MSFACMFKLRLDEASVYFVMLNEKRSVHGFESARKGLDFFEDANRHAIERGYGWAAGAMLNWMALQPRIFHFGTVDKLREMFGNEIRAEKLNGTGVHEVAFRCPDQEAARMIYEVAVEPRLT